MVKIARVRCHISDRAGCALLVVFSALRVTHQLRFLQGQTPVLVQTLVTQRAVEALDQRVLHRLSRMHKVQAPTVLIAHASNAVPGNS